jgi:RNA polymerase sigma factor (sigma-70 family)
MNDTSLSLLHRLRQTSDSEAWNRLMDMYAPLLKRWLGRYGVQESDADDLMQEVLLAVSKDVSEFDHNGRTGAFRSWLKMILIHRLRNFWRMRGRRPQATGNSDVQQQIDQLEDPTSEMSALWNRQHDEFVVRRLLIDTERLFAPKTWQAFLRQTLEGQRADQVAADLGMSLNAVFIAKSRVLNRLRQQADGLVDSSSDFSPNH